MFSSQRNILRIFQHSLILFIYFLILSESVIAEPSKNNLPPLNKQQLLNEAEKLAKQKNNSISATSYQKIGSSTIKIAKIRR